MYYSKMAYRVKSLLNRNRSKQFKFDLIAQEVAAKKHKHKDLKDTLESLLKAGKINRDGRYYQSTKEANVDAITGTFDARSLARNKSFAFVICPKYDVYVSSEDTSTAYHGDTVMVQVRSGRDRRKFGVISSIVERKNKIIVGTLEKVGKQQFVTPDSSRLHTSFDVIDAGKAVPGDKVVLEVTNWGNREMQKIPGGNIVEILGKAGEPEVEVLSVIRQYDLPLNFPDKVMAELDNLSEVITENEIAKRSDFRELLTLTIDPESARDFDDAISLEISDDSYKLYVHIADVAHYVKPGSELFKESLSRGNSFYFPKKVIPMLPEKISNKLCSLRPLEEKLTLTVISEYDKGFNLVSQKAVESVIKSDARFAYEEIDDLFDGKETEINSELKENLTQMRILATGLQKNRIKRGYLFFSLPETEYIFDDEGHIIDLVRSRETESHQLIENFMLVANEFIATELSVNTTMYRVHENPDEEKLMKLKTLLSKYDVDFPLTSNFNESLQAVLENLPNEHYQRVFNRMILRSMKKARYTTENRGHFGLGIQNYTHFTSPIRRLCDLVIHHQLKDKLNHKKTPFSGKDLYDWAGTASEKESVADDSERDVDFKNKMNFMKKKLGEEYTGIIVGVTKSKLLIEIDRYPVIGVVELSQLKNEKYEYLADYSMLVGSKNGKIIKLTDLVNVRVTRVDEDIFFQLLD